MCYIDSYTKILKENKDDIFIQTKLKKKSMIQIFKTNNFRFYRYSFIVLKNFANIFLTIFDVIGDNESNIFA